MIRPRVAPSAMRMAISLRRAPAARQQQVGHVDTRDQQHQPDDRRHQLAHVDDLVAQFGLMSPSASGSSVTVRPSFSCGYRMASCAAVVFIPASAWSRGDARLQPPDQGEQQGAAGIDLPHHGKTCSYIVIGTHRSALTSALGP